jgi:DNA recombination protein RmuC
MIIEVIAALVGGLIIGLIATYFLLKNKKRDGEELNEILKKQINEVFPEALAKANSQLITLADQKLKAEKQTIQSDLQNKKSAIEDLVKLMKDELKETNQRFETSEKNRINSFSTLSQKIEEINKSNDKLSATTDNLRKLLSNNQLRGQFGEQVADNLLKMSGFVQGVDYEFNKEQAGSETRPDFSVFLPDGTRINVDAKFPYANLQKYIEADQEDEEVRKRYFDAFKQDVRKKIKDVTSRDYINPEDRTVDFVILFIPNEMIFSYIYDKMNDTWEEGMQKKVIMAGPFNFTAILRLVKQAYDNFKIQANAQKIIGYIRSFEKEFGKYNEEFEKLGGKISQLNNQYEVVNTTRTRQLLRTVDKIKLEDGSQDVTPSKQLGLEPPTEV